MVPQSLRWEIIHARVMFTALELLCWNYLRGGKLMTGYFSFKLCKIYLCICINYIVVPKSVENVDTLFIIIIRSLPRGEQFLVRWAAPQLHDIDALSGMVDPSLKGTYPSKSLSRLADIISLCVQVSFFRLCSYRLLFCFVNLICSMER